jgi:outer membrane receptor protein involved in Fe transport
MKTKRRKAIRNPRLAVAVSCLLLTGWLQAPVVLAEEQTDKPVITEEVDVTDTRLQERQAIQKTEITAEDIKAQGAETAAQALEKVAGITVSSNNMQGKAAVSIRGSDANNTKVFVDGVPLSPVGDGVVDLSSIPADSIAKIEVFKGAAPVQYGSDAAGGVIYITTKKGGKQTATVSTAVGSWNTQRQNASVSGGSQQVDYFFNYKHETTDGYTWNTEKNAQFYDGKLGFRLNGSASLSLFGSYAKKSEELPDRYDDNGVMITSPGTGGTIGNPSNTKGFWYRTGMLRLDPVTEWRGGLTYNQRLGDSSDLKMTLYKSAEKKSMTASHVPDTITVTGGQESAAGVHGYQLEHTIKTSPVNTVLWGYNQEARRFDQDTEWKGFNTDSQSFVWTCFVPARYRYDSRSYFLQDTLKLGKLTTTLGYRHNVVEDDLRMDPNQQAIDLAGYRPIPGVTTSHTFKDPVAGFSYAVNDRTELHASVGKSFRYPQPVEIASGATVGTTLPLVKPEETLNRDLGVAYTTPDGLQLDFTYFNKKVTDKIQSKTVIGQTMFENLPEVTMKGFEAGISKKLSDKFKAFAQVTYTSAENPKTGRQINDQPEYKYSLGMNYTAAQGLKAYLALNYVGGRFSDFSNGTGNNPADPDPSTPPEFRAVSLPAYTTVDFMLTKELKNREYYIKLNNLLDKKYYSGAYLIAPGRYVEFGTDIKF